MFNGVDLELTGGWSSIPTTACGREAVAAGRGSGAVAGWPRLGSRNRWLDKVGAKASEQDKVRWGLMIELAL